MIRALSLLTVVLLTAGAAMSDQKFKVGVILPLSGDFSNFGKACQNAIELAKEELGMDLSSRIEILIEDDALIPRKSVDAFQKLTTTDQIGTAITFTSGCSNVIAPLAESMRLPMLAIGASDPKVVEGRKFVNSLWVSPATEGRVAFAEARRRGYKRIARIGSLHEGVQAIKKSFDAVNRGHIDVVLDEEYPADSRDFKTYIAKLRNQSKLDAIFVILLPGQTGIFAKQLRQAGVRQQMFNVETFENPEDLKVSEGAMTGSWYVNADDASGEFTKKFLQRFPESSLWSAPSCYDAVFMLANAVKGKIPFEKYLRTIKDFKGAQGIFSSTGDGLFTLAAIVKIVTKDGFEKQDIQPVLPSEEHKASAEQKPPTPPR